jgi:hypothetical protein
VVPDLGGVAGRLLDVTGLLAAGELSPVGGADVALGDGGAVQEPGIEVAGQQE